MQDRKIAVRFYSVQDHEKEAGYLALMHRQGWALDAISFPGMYHFRRIRPEDVIYCLDINTEGTSESESYQKMFEYQGFEYVLEYRGLQYFRRPAWDADDSALLCGKDAFRTLRRKLLLSWIVPLALILGVYAVQHMG